jgi:hypothetical protein
VVSTPSAALVTGDNSIPVSTATAVGAGQYLVAFECVIGM